MNNLQKIQEAYECGYGAVMKCTLMTDNQRLKKPSPVVLVASNAIGLQNGHFIFNKAIDNWKIIGYKYLGELGGNKPIPEGQKFRGKETGKIYTYIRMASKELLEVSEGGNSTTKVYKSELEPIFE